MKLLIFSLITGSQNTSMSYDKETVFRPNADVSKFGVNRIATK